MSDTEQANQFPTSIESFSTQVENLASNVMKSILLEAEEIINGDREQTYGHFSKNLENIASLWQTYINAAADEDGNIELTAKDVCMMMCLLKIAREANKHKRDNLVDLCGYAALAEKVEELNKEE